MSANAYSTTASFGRKAAKVAARADQGGGCSVADWCAHCASERISYHSIVEDCVSVHGKTILRARIAGRVRVVLRRGAGDLPCSGSKLLHMRLRPECVNVDCDRTVRAGRKFGAASGCGLLVKILPFLRIQPVSAFFEAHKKF